MRTIVLSGQYKKDLKLARKRNLPEENKDTRYLEIKKIMENYTF